MKHGIARLKCEAVALWLCARHPRTPTAARLIALAVVAYAFSPIDLIPDFIPVIGLLDDALVLPLGIWLARKLLPPDVLAECREQAEQWVASKRSLPRSYPGAAFIVTTWLALLALAWLAYRA